MDLTFCCKHVHASPGQSSIISAMPVFCVSRRRISSFRNSSFRSSSPTSDHRGVGSCNRDPAWRLRMRFCSGDSDIAAVLARSRVDEDDRAGGGLAGASGGGRRRTEAKWDDRVAENKGGRERQHGVPAVYVIQIMATV